MIENAKLGFLGMTSSEIKLLERLFNSNDIFEIDEIAQQLNDKLNNKQDKINKYSYDKKALEGLVKTAISYSGRVKNAEEIRENVMAALSKRDSTYKKIFFCVSQITGLKRKMVASNRNNLGAKKEIEHENDDAFGYSGYRSRKDNNSNSIDDIVEEKEDNFAMTDEEILLEDTPKAEPDFANDMEFFDQSRESNVNEAVTANNADEREMLDNPIVEENMEISNDAYDMDVINEEVDNDIDVADLDDRDIIVEQDKEIAQENDDYDMDIRSFSEEENDEYLPEEIIEDNQEKTSEQEEVKEEYAEEIVEDENMTDLEIDLMRDELYERAVSQLRDDLEYSNFMGEDGDKDFDKFERNLDEIDREYPLKAEPLTDSSELGEMLNESTDKSIEDTNGKIY